MLSFGVAFLLFTFEFRKENVKCQKKFGMKVHNLSYMMKL